MRIDLRTDLRAALGLRSAARPFPDPHAAPLPAGPPPGSAGWSEVAALAQLPRLLAAAPRLAVAPRGDGSVVVDVPGWRAPEASGAPLRAWLRWLGYDARGWGFGVNRGSPERDAERLTELVVGLAEDAGGPVALVGWSLGGVVAREVARQAPEAVRCVVTYGTPVVGGPTHTVGARTYGPDECARVTALIEELDARSPIPVPLTAVLTRRDAVVSWTACIDRASPDVRHVEVDSTHVGLGIDPDVWLTVATALAEPAGAVQEQAPLRAS
jgi:pimeloyl-ACP methyl ester carboxylesterase